MASEYNDTHQNPPINAFPHNYGYSSIDPRLSQQSDVSGPAQNWQYNSGDFHYPHGPAGAYADLHDRPGNNQASNGLGDFYSSILQDSSAQFGNDALPVSTGLNSIYTSQNQSPSLIVPNVQEHAFQQHNGSVAQSQTIAPDALQSALPQRINSKYPEAKPNDAKVLQQESAPSAALYEPIPKGISSGAFVVTSFEDIQKTCKVQRVHNFLFQGEKSRDTTIARATLPPYVARKSRNEIKSVLAKFEKDPDNAPKLKRGRGRPRKEAESSRQAKGRPDKPRSVSLSESDSSGEESEYASSDEEAESSPLPASRPTVPTEAVRYDAIKILWQPRGSVLSAERIRTALKEFWEIIKSIRDRWKSDAQAVKEAEEAKKVHDLPTLKERVANQRGLLEIALKTAIEFGHPSIIETFGENVPFTVSLSQFLTDRAKETDFSGTLSIAILEMLAHCSTLTEGDLEKAKLSNVLLRFSKRGNEQVKSLVKKIHDNAVQALKRKKELNKTGSSNAAPKDPKSPVESSVKPVSSLNGLKRARAPEAGGEQVTKRVASQSLDGTPSVVKPPQSPSQASGSQASVKPESSAAAVTKSKQVTVKPSGLFSSLQSAAKKPGTSIKGAQTPSAQTKPQSTQTEKKSSTSTAAPKSYPAFSLSATLATLQKQEDVQPAKAKVEQPSAAETAEENAKLARKAQRRKLKVHFKPEPSLVEIRWFHHDPDEELGHDMNQIKHVGDIDSEGRMFKMGKAVQDDMMDLDDDDDELTAIDDISRPYPASSLVDFSNVDADERNRNYAPYGGGVQTADTSEKAVQEQHEANTLVAIYAQPSDIPPSPKEPVAENDDAIPAPKTFGKPTGVYASRLIDLSAAQPQTTVPVPAEAPSLGMDAQLAPPVAGNQPDPATFSNLEAIFAQFSGQAPQSVPVPAQPPFMAAQQAMPAQTMAPSNTYGMNEAAPGGFPPAFPPMGQQPGPVPDLAALLSSLQQPTQNQQQSSQHSMPSMQQMQEDMRIFQQMMGHGAPPPNFPPFPPPNIGPGQNQQGQGQGQGVYENPDRKRWRMQGDEEDDDDSRNDLKRQKANAKSMNKYKVLPCKYWLEGKCRKGDDCTYKHGND